jgi:hypothetical protein
VKKQVTIAQIGLSIEHFGTYAAVRTGIADGPVERRDAIHNTKADIQALLCPKLGVTEYIAALVAQEEGERI